MIERKPSLLWAWSPLIYLGAGVAFLALAVYVAPYSAHLSGTFTALGIIMWVKSFFRLRRR